MPAFQLKGFQKGPSRSRLPESEPALTNKLLRHGRAQDYEESELQKMGVRVSKRGEPRISSRVRCICKPNTKETPVESNPGARNTVQGFGGSFLHVRMLGSFFSHV